MGAWGIGHFDNDGALDFTIDLTAKNSLDVIEHVFDEILKVKGYIDVDYGEPVIAAGEVVAMLKGKPAKDMPDSLIQWHQKHQLSVTGTLISKAIKAVEKAFDKENSEFRQLREEPADKFGLVEASINDLSSRLR